MGDPTGESGRGALRLDFDAVGGEMGMVCHFVTHLPRLRFTTTMWRVHRRIPHGVPMLFEPVDHRGRWIANARETERVGNRGGSVRAETTGFALHFGS